MVLQVQRNVFFVRLITSRFQGCGSIPHKIKGSAGDQLAPNQGLNVTEHRRKGDTIFVNKEHFFTTRFAALLAFAVVGVFFMGAGVTGNSDSVGLYGIVLIGQLAVDLGAVLPVLALRFGQVGLGQGDFIAVAACTYKFVSVHIPLIGNLILQTACRRGIYPDIRLNHFPIRCLISDLWLLLYGKGRTGDGDPCDGDRSGRSGTCFAVCGQLQLIDALLDGFVGGNGDGNGFAVRGFFRCQTGVLALPFHFQSVHLDLASGNGEGRRLTV